VSSDDYSASVAGSSDSIARCQTITHTVKK